MCRCVVLDGFAGESSFFRPNTQHVAGVLAGVAQAPIWLRELHPISAAFAMVAADLVIVANALRLRNVLR